MDTGMLSPLWFVRLGWQSKNRIKKDRYRACNIRTCYKPVNNNQFSLIDEYGTMLEGAVRLGDSPDEIKVKSVLEKIFTKYERVSWYVRNIDLVQR
jgi:hypothetical protein